MKITWEKSRTQYISQENRKVVQEILSEMDKTLGDGVSVRVDIDLDGWLLFFSFNFTSCNIITTRIEDYFINEIVYECKTTRETVVKKVAREQRERIVGGMMKEIGVYRT